jgi:phospholipase/lecithinase/hemolysin
LFYLFDKNLPGPEEKHQNNNTLSSGLIACFALELACNTQTARLCRKTARRDKSASKTRSTIMNTIKRFLHPICILAVTCLLPTAATADTDYDRLVVFGDSLSDPGNAFVLTGMALKPPYTALIPEHPYARGGHRLSDGSTWIERMAKKMKLRKSAGPALRVPGKFSNYAVDRTRACSESPSPSHLDLSSQVGMFLTQFAAAPDSALYVVFAGSNDVRDALVNPEIGESILGCALLSLADNIQALIAAGARTFLVPNVPNLGLVPAVALQGPEAQQAATEVSFFFNLQLEGILADIETAYGGLVRFYRLDTFELLTQISVEHPELNVTDPCIDVFSGTVCKNTKKYLFWDGIHPTRTGHKLIAEEAASVLGLTR